MKTTPIWFLPALAVLTAGSLFAKDFDVRAYGAKGDGTTKDTAAIQAAIDACHADGGGRVVLERGTYLTAPITLRGGVDLHIEVNAKLLGSPDLADYPNQTDIRHLDLEHTPRKRNVALIYAEECRDIALSGRGTIDANGSAFVRAKNDKDWMGYPFERKVDKMKSLPRVVCFAGCRNVTVTDVTLTGLPSGWGYWINDCDFVHFSRAKVMADVRFPNNDGIHLNCCRDVTISDCFLETGDDSIIVRANSAMLKENRPCERITVVNCTMKAWCSGIRLAWVNDGVIRNCVFSNLVMYDCTKGIVIQTNGITPLDCGREPTFIENILFSNIVMDRIYTHPLMVDATDDPTTLIKAIRNVRFSHIDAHAVFKPYFNGRAAAPYEGFRFDNCTFDLIDPKTLPLRIDRHGCSPWNIKGNVRPWNCRNFVFDEVTAKSWPEIRDTAGAGACGPKPKVWIKDTIANADKYAKLNSLFGKAFAFMRRKDLKTLPCGRYDIVPGKCWASVAEGTNVVALSERVAEVHRNFIDIQLPLSGPETIGVAEALDTHLAAMGGFNCEKDFGLLKTEVEPLVLQPGEFAILFPPRCLHAPGCLAEGTTLPHRKVVIKVAAE